MKVYLKYGFVFEPAETWQHLSQFDSDLATFFRERGFEAEIVKTAEGQEQLRILYIRRAELAPTGEDGKIQSKSRLKATGAARDSKGRFYGRSKR